MKTLKEILSKTTGKKQPVVFAFGRFNPPTYGHQKLIERVLTIAKRVKGKPVLYVSATQDKKRNPFDVKYKIKVIKAIYKSKIQINAATGRERTFMEILKNRFDKKYTDVYMIAGSDRVAEFKQLINKYNGKDYNFNTVNVVSAGNRDPDSEKSDESISASKMREFASKNDYNSFRQGVMKGTKEKDAMKLFKDLKDKMGVREDMLAPNDDNEMKLIRENYHNNEIFNINEWVENIKDQTVGKIIKRGPSYVQYEMEDGGVKKAWLQDVVPVESVNVELQKEDVDQKKLVLQKNSDRLIKFSSFDEDINKAKKEQEKDVNDPEKEKEVKVKRKFINKTPGQPAIADVNVWSQGPDQASQIKTSRKFSIVTPGQVRDYGKMVAGRKFQKYEGTELTANDVKEWALEETTITKFKDRYENNWRVELDKATDKLLAKVNN